MSVYLIGGGGHAKVVLATLEAAGRSVAGVFDDDEAAHGTRVLGVPVVGPVAAAADADGEIVIAVGSNRARHRIAAALDGRVAWATAVHPAATLHASVSVGEGTVVFAGAVVQPATVLGRHVIVNTGASIDHDGRIGDAAHVAPGARLAGAVTVGEGGFVGIGACVIPGRSVGAWATVGAGGAVVRDVPAGATAVGVPARVRG